MSNARFWVRNWLHDSTTSLKNGTGGGAPALEQVADFPMANLLVRDSDTIWRSSGAPPNPTLVDFDLGGDVAVIFAAVVNRLNTTGTITVKSATAAAGYPPAGWTTRGTISGGAGACAFTTFSSSPAGRYWRIEVATSGGAQYALGNFFLANSVLDFGHQWAPGVRTRIQRARVRAQTDALAPVIQEVGRTRRFFSLPDPTTSATNQALIAAIGELGKPFMYGDPVDNLYEVELTEDAVEWAQMFNVEPFDVTLLLEQLH